jgi:hypothetical protein
MDRVPASGSCIRCRRALGLASVKQGDVWYCTPACAEGDAPSPDLAEPAVAEAALYARPRRHFRSRAPKELRASLVRRTPAGGSATGTR